MGEPLFWAGAAALVGTALGVFGLFLWRASLADTFYVDPTYALVSQVAQLSGGALVAASSLGAGYLLWSTPGARRAVLLGAALLALLLAANAVGVASAVYWNTGDRLRGYEESSFLAVEAAAVAATTCLPSFVLLCLAVGCFASREKRLGVLLGALCLLSVPYGVVRFWLLPAEPGAYGEPGPLADFVLLLVGWYPVGVSPLQAPLWVLFGVALLRRAGFRALGGAFRVGEAENLGAARRLYEGGLGRGDPSVVDDLVSEDFRDLKRGSCGRISLKRVFASLWSSYPDLEVSVEDQRAEGDVVTTRLLLSGTDRGGTLWYPPTGRRVAFGARFLDRFAGGKVVEHAGEADTEDLLKQLGLDAER